MMTDKFTKFIQKLDAGAQLVTAKNKLKMMSSINQNLSEQLKALTQQQSSSNLQQIPTKDVEMAQISPKTPINLSTEQIQHAETIQKQMNSLITPIAKPQILNSEDLESTIPKKNEPIPRATPAGPITQNNNTNNIINSSLKKKEEIPVPKPTAINVAAQQPKKPVTLNEGPKRESTKRLYQNLLNRKKLAP